MVVFAPSGPVALGSQTSDGELYGLRTNLMLAPAQRQEVDVRLQGLVVVSGTVVAMDNSPLSGVQIGLARPRSSPGEEPQFVGSLTSTRDNGEFRFQGTRPAGRYELLALTQRGPVSLLDGQIIDFDPQQPLTNLTFHLAPMKKGRWRSFDAAEGLRLAHRLGAGADLQRQARGGVQIAVVIEHGDQALDVRQLERRRAGDRRCRAAGWR